MSSINTNFAAMTALQTLTQTNKALTQTQERISTGFRVGEASDNAAYWSIATTMRSDNKALSTVQDALNLGAATVDVAYTGMKSAIDLVDQIKTKLVAAREPGVARAKIQSDLNELQGSLKGIADSAVFSGENWLKIDSTGAVDIDKSIVSSFSRSGGSVSVGTIAVKLYNATDGKAVGLFDANATATAKAGILDKQQTLTSGGTFTIASLNISALTDSAADLTDLVDMIAGADKAIASMTDAATTLGSVKARVGIQKDFVKNLMDAIDRGISGLVDADMNQESTKLQALQVKQQLGVQALSIANSSNQSILSLFRG